MSDGVPSRSTDFRGEIVRTRRVPGFTITDLRHRRASKSGGHAHRLAYVSWLASGAYRERDVAAELDYRRGEARFHPPDYSHGDEIGATGARFLCVEVNDPGGLSPGVLSRPASCAASSEAAGLAAALFRELRDDHPGSALVLEGLALQLLGSIVRFPSDRSMPRWLARVEERLREECPARLRIADLAAEAGVHPAHLARAYRKHFRRTIGEDLRFRRVELARRLVETGESLSTAAAEAGFSDQSHFSRAFRGFHGMSPGEYRRSGNVRFRPKC